MCCGAIAWWRKLRDDSEQAAATKEGLSEQREKGRIGHVRVVHGEASTIRRCKGETRVRERERERSRCSEESQTSQTVSSKLLWRVCRKRRKKLPSVRASHLVGDGLGGSVRFNLYGLLAELTRSMDHRPAGESNSPLATIHV